MADDPFLIPRKQWLDDIHRSAQWYRDRHDDPRADPPLPKTIYIDRDAFIRTSDAKAYKTALLRKAGIPTPGRPPLTAESR